ncbi:GNAT family N-acetyltransferase [Fulvivirga sediminis]|uniref:GNAT family N-acetyltransferase n=1 Tax=Fulvivirga sediminis TaxID=2803949 RepID=A0A937K2Y2_9BACT|nr:GNAT family N-acetyltransferase [Fulvivirga sediminis]MBL3658840.1 GNAT family N-acetyltransferase [Fulvivirga sediminis]
MLKLFRTDSEHRDYEKLTDLLNEDLAGRYKVEPSLFAKINEKRLSWAVVLYHGEVAIGCGAIRPFEENSVEIKRVYIHPDHRGSGAAYQLLAELENWAKEMSYSRIVLETGTGQPEAIKFYKKHGYTSIPNYCEGTSASRCFEKMLKHDQKQCVAG